MMHFDLSDYTNIIFLQTITTFFSIENRWSNKRTVSITLKRNLIVKWFTVLKNTKPYSFVPGLMACDLRIVGLNTHPPEILICQKQLKKWIFGHGRCFKNTKTLGHNNYLITLDNFDKKVEVPDWYAVSFQATSPAPTLSWASWLYVNLFANRP